MAGAEFEIHYVQEQIRYCSDKIFESFKLFVQYFSAVVGGSVYLSQQLILPSKAREFVWLSDIAVILIVGVSATMILENVRSRGGFKVRLSELRAGERGRSLVPPPQVFLGQYVGVVRIEIAMVGAMVLSGLSFCIFNPF